MSVVGIERSLVILKHLAASQEGLGVREISRVLGYSPGVVQKCFQALDSQEFVTKDPVSQRYQLGPAALQVGLAGLSKLEIRQVARPHLEALAHSTGETALLGVPSGNMAIYIDKVLSPAEVRVDATVGTRRPFNCTAVGKALLAFMPKDTLRVLAKGGAFVQATERSTIKLAVLEQELSKIRDQGVAVDCEEFLPGVMCIAAPIRNHDNVVVGAMSISGPFLRVQTSESEMIRQVIRASQVVSTALGYYEPSPQNT